MTERVQVRNKKPEAKRENRPSQTRKTGPSQSISSPVEQILFLQRTIGNQAVGRLIKSGTLKAKLRIGQPGDIYEQEADRVAEQVMRMHEPLVSKETVSKETKVSGLTAGTPVQRRCPGCTDKTKKGEDEEVLRAKEVSNSTPEVTKELESSINGIRGGGQPLPESVCAFYEPRFGADFSGVRVHTGSHAAETVKSINARAFTVGNNIAFGGGQFAPGSHEGRKLLAHELTHMIQQGAPTLQRQEPKDAGEKSGSDPISSTSPGMNKVAFVREEGLNLRERADQKSTSLATLKFGQRVHTLEDPRPQPGWQKVAVLGQTGYVFGPRIHFPPEHLIQNDPELNLIKVKPGQTFWGLVKDMYDIQGNESTKDQNINHFINAIRVVNKPEAFNITTDFLDDVGNFFISGRDATDTLLIAGVDLWIPSFGVAARMDVGSGTVRGEITRFVKKIEQKIDDFKLACQLSGKYIPNAIAKHAGEIGAALLDGLIEFAKDAAKILAVSTAVGALIGALFGGVGALPGAEIGFEIGLLILQLYGLVMLIEAVIGIAGDLLSQLGQFIKLVWIANGDKKQLEEAAKSLADALGILVSAVLVAAAAYFLKKGTEAFMKTKFAKTVGERPLAQWLKQRQELQTTRQVLVEGEEGQLGKGMRGCFVAGTKVLTTEGEKPIENLIAGEVVVSFDPSSGERVSQQITHTFVWIVPVVLDIRVDSTTISCSPEHPFWVPGYSWQKAKELKPGMPLLTKMDSIVNIGSIQKRQGSFTVFNIEVEGIHTYFVSNLGILVHNKAARRRFEPPVRDHQGKVGGELPKSGNEIQEAFNIWTREEMEFAAEELQLSIAARQAEQIRLGETSVGQAGQPVGAAHRVRIAQEITLLRAIKKKLSGT